MFYMKGWLRSLRQFEPSVISISKQEVLLRKISTITENTEFKRNNLYIGKLSAVAYRFRAISGITLILINDTSYKLDKLVCGDNTVIILPNGIDSDELRQVCTSYLIIQDEIIEMKHRLLERIYENCTMQGILDALTDVTGNPVMVIDNGFRVIGYSAPGECSDLLWNETVSNGYCSYEFISQFNRINEIADMGRSNSPVLAGCLMSPMRRCIIPLMSGSRSIGYLLAIESDSTFNESRTEILDVASRMLVLEMIHSSSKPESVLYKSSWEAVINAIEGTPKSDMILREYLLSEGLRTNSAYYIILFSLNNYVVRESETSPLYSLFRTMFPRSTFCYYKKDALMIVELPEGDEELCRRLKERESEFREKEFVLAISDAFTELSDIRRYYDQAKKAQAIMEQYDLGVSFCTYENIRVFDMILSQVDPDSSPLFLRNTEKALIEYDLQNGTEYFRTLYSYIKHSRRLGDVADELHIHKNSVSYRINRIKELFNLDLNDAETRIGLYLAYNVMELKNRKKHEENQ